MLTLCSIRHWSNSFRFEDSRQILSPCQGDIADSGIVLSYRSARLYPPRGHIQRKTWSIGPYNLTLCPFVHSTHSDSNTFTMGNPMPESTLTLCQSRLYPPVRDFGFGLSQGLRIWMLHEDTRKHGVTKRCRLFGLTNR